MTSFYQLFAYSVIRMAILSVITNTAGCTIWQTYDSGSLNLQKEGVNSAIDIHKRLILTGLAGWATTNAGY